MSIFSPKTIKKAAASAAEHVYLTTAPFEGEGTCKVLTCEAKNIPVKGQNAEAIKCIAQVEILTHGNPAVLGTEATIYRDPANGFHNDELVQFVAALAGKNPKGISIKDMDKVFRQDDDGEPVMVKPGKTIGFEVTSREVGSNVYHNLRFFAVNKAGARLSAIELSK
jgi:hypothetical protein